MYSGASVGGASLLNNGKADICLNWAGQHALPALVLLAQATCLIDSSIYCSLVAPTGQCKLWTTHCAHHAHALDIVHLYHNHALTATAPWAQGLRFSMHDHRWRMGSHA